MNKIPIKPLSVNSVWKGKRYKTPAYKKYETATLFLLPSLKIPSGNLHITLEFGFSSKGSDPDNPVKPFVDILSKRYGFNDNRVYKYTIEKKIVKKGEEYTKFKIEEYHSSPE